MTVFTVDVAAGVQTGLSFLEYGLMRRALMAALLVGIAAPLVGIFVVQRRMSMIGDGLGHVALAGVAVGLLTRTNPVFTALVCAIGAAVLIEWLKMKARTSSDVAIALLFYGGIALGVVLITKAPSGSAVNLTSYLFGSIQTTQVSDLIAFSLLTVVIVAVIGILAPRIFAVSNDAEYAHASGMHVLPLNIIHSALTACTVVLSMRVIGLLLISALMVLPAAMAQQVTSSFRAAMAAAVAFGVITSVGGTIVSWYADAPSGGTVVMLGVVLFGLTVWAGHARRRGILRW